MTDSLTINRKYLFPDPPTICLFFEDSENLEKVCLACDKPRPSKTSVLLDQTATQPYAAQTSAYIEGRAHSKSDLIRAGHGTQKTTPYFRNPLITLLPGGRSARGPGGVGPQWWGGYGYGGTGGAPRCVGVEVDEGTGTPFQNGFPTYNGPWNARAEGPCTRCRRFSKRVRGHPGYSPAPLGTGPGGHGWGRVGAPRLWDSAPGGPRRDHFFRFPHVFQARTGYAKSNPKI